MNSTSRRPIIAANWKMHLGRVEDALPHVRRIRRGLNEIEGIDRVLCPPFTVLALLSEVLRPTSVGLGAQNMHWGEQGPHTGEVSPAMLVGLCQYAILGHSERRAANNETDLTVNRKVHAAFSHRLTPIICVGEDLAQNEAGATHTFVRQQVQKALAGLTPEQVPQCVIAYEPIWAIGTGKAAIPAVVNRLIGLTIRGAIADVFGETCAQAVRVQYGGSVNVGNIATFMTMPEIDGALVGGASLKPGFVELVRLAASVYDR